MSEPKSYDCEVCEKTIKDREYSRYTPMEKAVCVDCWFDELDSRERKFYSERAERLRENREEENV